MPHGRRQLRQIMPITDEETYNRWWVDGLPVPLIIAEEPQAVGRDDRGCHKKGWLVAMATRIAQEQAFIACDTDWFPLQQIPFEEQVYDNTRLAMTPDGWGQRVWRDLWSSPEQKWGKHLGMLREHCAGLMFLRGAKIADHYQRVWGDPFFHDRFSGIGWADQICMSVLHAELPMKETVLWPEGWCWSYLHAARSAASIHFHGPGGKERMRALGF